MKKHYEQLYGVHVWGEPLVNAVDQMEVAMQSGPVHGAALMADHHLGYSVPVGGVVAYHNAVSPSGVGFDIGCGNKAVKLDTKGVDILHRIPTIMDDVFSTISFGVGRTNDEDVDHELFDSPVWSIPAVAPLKEMARKQLGTVGSGNHYVDLFVDEDDHIWIGVHFGSRGLGHKIATHYIKEGGGKDGIHVAPVVLDTMSDLGREYVLAMGLAGEYAYAGRDWVCQRVADIIGGTIIDEVHNHHNFAWEEEHGDETLWVVRKGATPAFPGQRGFVGASMAEPSVILKGVGGEEAERTYHSTVHGAGRVLSRTQAKGKTKFDKETGERRVIQEPMVDAKGMYRQIQQAGVELRGGGVDEAPQCYKRLNEVLLQHSDSITIEHTLTPVGVAMAGANEYDPYKD